MTNEEIQQAARGFAARWPQTSEGSYRIIEGGAITYDQALADFAVSLVSDAYEEAARAVCVCWAGEATGAHIAECPASSIRALKDSLTSETVTP